MPPTGVLGPSWYLSDEEKERMRKGEGSGRTIWDSTKDVAKKGYGWLTSPSGQQELDAERSAKLGALGDESADFARQQQQQYGLLGQEGNQERDFLRSIARGEDSISAEQLRQGLQQNVAGQMAMANSARPGSGAMAARNAALNASRAASGLAGQQAVAGLQERQQAQRALMEALLRQRGQDLDALSGGRRDATSAWGGQVGTPNETDRQKQLAMDALKWGSKLGGLV